MTLTSPYMAASYLALESLNDALSELPTDTVIADEGFLSSVVDVMLRVFYNAKVTLTGALKDFKRSELQAYLDSHTLAMRALLKTPPTALVFPKDIPVARGMTSTYGTTAGVINQLFTQIDISTTMTAARQHLTQLKGAGDDMHLQEKVVMEAAKSLSRVTKPQVESALKTVFKKSAVLGTVPAEQAFGSAQAFFASVTGILAFGQEYQKAAQWGKELSTLDALMGDIIACLKTGVVVPSFIKALSAFVQTLAVQVDMYGALLAVCQNVEHAFVQAVHKVRFAEK